MPTSYVVDVEHRVVRCKAWGALSNEDLVDHYRAIAADPAFDSSFAQLADLTDVDRFDLDISTIRREALDVVFDPSAQRALVAPSDIAFGLSRIYGSYAELAPQKIRVFRERVEAEKWLGLSEA